MNWIDEKYSEEHDERILTQDHNEIVKNLLCEHIKNLDSRMYKLRMENLILTRQNLELKKQLKNQEK